MGKISFRTSDNLELDVEEIVVRQFIHIEMVIEVARALNFTIHLHDITSEVFVLIIEYYKQRIEVDRKASTEELKKLDAIGFFKICEESRKVDEDFLGSLSNKLLLDVCKFAANLGAMKLFQVTIEKTRQIIERDHILGFEKASDIVEVLKAYGVI